MDEMNVSTFFMTAVYSIHKPEFHYIVNNVADEYIEDAQLNSNFSEIYPMYQSKNFDATKPGLNKFAKFINETSHEILESQGYNLDGITTSVDEMWCQKHFKTSGHERHFHGMGSVITGFYFLEVPENSSRLIIYDPRQAKEFSNLPEKNVENITLASQNIFFTPTPGTFIFTNSWLNHSFSRNESETPFKMIHFNIKLINDERKKLKSAIVI